MDKVEISSLIQRFQRIPKRAERADAGVLEETFVSVAGIDNILFNPEHQIIIGRRGTGKTHALKYICQRAMDKASVAVFVDLRVIGSGTSIYSSDHVSRKERIAKLVTDFFSAIHEGLYELATTPPTSLQYGHIAPQLDQLADAVSQIYVEKESERSESSEYKAEQSQSSTIQAKVGKSAVAVELGAANKGSVASAAHIAETTKGKHEFAIHIPSLSSVVRNITSQLQTRMWVTVDEWSSIPDDMQPYLADVIRRVLFPNPGVTVIIAAIEHRSRFQLSNGSNYIGIEIGADCAASINLDDFMVLENDPANSTELFKSIIFRHLKNVDDKDLCSFTFNIPDDMVRAAFTGKTFQELIRAAEGVPRDAINILALAARRAQNRRISIKDLRRAAAQWFTQDKSQFLKQNKNADHLLAWIVDQVIGHKRARAFLIESNAQSKLMDDLYDGRLLHVLKRSVSAHDRPGKRYIAYKIDYGCYVDLLTTAKAPEGLLAGDEQSGLPFIEVPPDDYRSIRRSILDLNEFNSEKLRGGFFQVVIGEGVGKSIAHWVIQAKDASARHGGEPKPKRIVKRK